MLSSPTIDTAVPAARSRRELLGGLVFTALTLALYAAMRRLARRAG